MTKSKHRQFVAEIQMLVKKTGLSKAEIARRLDATPETLSRWLAGDQVPAHPAMLLAALQMTVLVQSGVITKKLIEALQT